MKVIRGNVWSAGRRVQFVGSIMPSQQESKRIVGIDGTLTEEVYFGIHAPISKLDQENRVPLPLQRCRRSVTPFLLCWPFYLRDQSNNHFSRLNLSGTSNSPTFSLTTPTFFLRQNFRCYFLIIVKFLARITSLSSYINE